MVRPRRWKAPEPDQCHLPTLDYAYFLPSRGANAATYVVPPLQHQSLTIDSFGLLSITGRGSVGKVMQVRKRDTGCTYALKMFHKAHVRPLPRSSPLVSLFPSH
jgi:hypothetical protein